MSLIEVLVESLETSGMYEIECYKACKAKDIALIHTLPLTATDGDIRELWRNHGLSTVGRDVATSRYMELHKVDGEEVYSSDSYDSDE